MCHACNFLINEAILSRKILHRRPLQNLPLNILSLVQNTILIERKHQLVVTLYKNHGTH